MLESVRCCAFSVSNDAAMQTVAKLLGLSDDLLRETMTTRTMTTAALPTELAAARSHAIVPHSTPNNHPLLTNGANEPAWARYPAKHVSHAAQYRILHAMIPRTAPYAPAACDRSGAHRQHVQVRDKFKIPLKPESAAHSRDALAKSLYRFARSLFSASPHPKHARTQVGCSSKWCNGRCDGTCMHRVVRFACRLDWFHYVATCRGMLRHPAASGFVGGYVWTIARLRLEAGLHVATCHVAASSSTGSSRGSTRGCGLRRVRSHSSACSISSGLKRSRSPPAPIYTGTRPTRATFAPGLGSLLSRLHRHQAKPPATSASGPGLPLPHLHRD